jgi:hypothetical protein
MDTTASQERPAVAEAPVRAPPRARPPTEFDRLADAFERAYRRRDAFFEAGQIFADGLTDAFADYLKAPRAAIAFQPESVDLGQVGLRRFPPEEAIQVRDGWFVFRITVQLGPQRFISFPLSFRQSGEGLWTVKLTLADERFEVPESFDGAEDAFFVWVDQAASSLDAMLDGVVEGGDPAFAVVGLGAPR